MFRITKILEEKFTLEYPFNYHLEFKNKPSLMNLDGEVDRFVSVDVKNIYKQQSKIKNLTASFQLLIFF